ncbi:MAG: flagellar hook-length control protein FliK [Selenomonadaceae bacterium]|nr:flagellar hook-length control protein FliK [Selenomonadaceae bacterium]
MADTNIASLLSVQASTSSSAPASRTAGVDPAGSKAAPDDTHTFGQALHRVSAREDSSSQGTQNGAAAKDSLQGSADGRDVQDAQGKQNSGKADAKSRDAAQSHAKNVAEKTADTPALTQDAEDDGKAVKADAQPTQMVNLLFSVLEMQEQPSEVPDEASGLTDAVMPTSTAVCATDTRYAANPVNSANPALQTILPQAEDVSAKGQDMLKVLSGQGWQTTEARASQHAQAVAETALAEAASVQEAVHAMLQESGTSADLTAALQGLSSPAILQAKRGSAAEPDSALSKLVSLTRQTVAETASVDMDTAEAIAQQNAAATTTDVLTGEAPKPAPTLQQPSAQVEALSPMTGRVEVVTEGAPQELQTQSRLVHLTSPADAAQATSGADTDAVQTAALSPMTGRVEVVTEGAPQELQTQSRLVHLTSPADAAQATSGADADAVQTALQQAVRSFKDAPFGDSSSNGQDTTGSQETGKAETVSQTGSGSPTASVSAFQQAVHQSIHGAQDTTQTPQTAQQDYHIQQQIVDQARLIRRGEDTQMVIRLKPEHLGNLMLKVSVSADGSVTASFHSDNAQVRTIIENSLSQLRTELNQQGIKVDQVEVYAGLADGGLPQQSGQHQSGQRQGGWHAMRSTREGVEALEDEQNLQAVLAQQSGENSAAGIDYRV